MEFSHHSSNPLEARKSDLTNASYNRSLRKARAKEYDGSSDPLTVWSEATKYREHINEAVGATVHPQRLGPYDVTPKAGGSRSGAVWARKARELFESDDELALVDNDNDASTSEVRRVVEVKEEDDMDGDDDMKEEDEMDEEDETRDDEVKEEDEVIEEDDILIDTVSDVDSEEINVDGHDAPEGDFFDGEHFPDEDDEMRSIKDSSRADSSLGSMSPLTPLSSRQSSPYSSPQSSRPPSPDEARTLTLRPSDEQDEILDEIDQLYTSVPELLQDYSLVDRLGTGTFSSVYKAIDLAYNDCYNEPWLGHHPPESSAYYHSAGPSYRGRGGRAARSKQGLDEDDGKEDSGPYAQVNGNVYVAVKRIYTTSGPERIRNELSILEDCRGCRHSSQIITAFRNDDQVVIVLPYHRNMDFREFYQSLHPEGIKCYFRCLFRALRDIHARGIIHRDVKPANFLYDPFTGIGTLCDFGLASRMEPSNRVQQQGKCLHDVFSEAEPHGRNRDVDPSLEHTVKQAQREARAKSNMAADKVGYPEQDRRPLSKANRAGTRGFRAPEVLLKCGSQTGAVDVWSAGVILLFFLTGKFPIFQSNDDVEGLMELALIMGRRNVEKVATLHGRTFSSNVPDLSQNGIAWSEFVERLNPDIHTPKKYDMRFYPHNCKHRDGRDGRSSLTSMAPPARSSPPPAPSIDAPERAPSKHAERYANPPTAERYGHVLKLAFHLLEQVLHFESTKRYTPRKVLYHPFLDEAGADGDDQFVPHRVGDGVCGRFHYRESDGAHTVRIERRCRCREPASHGMSDGEGEGEEGEEHVFEDLLDVEAGRGIPIGTSPCEYHRDMDSYSILDKNGGCHSVF